MIASARSERGQVTVMAAIFVVILVGMAGLVLDVGSWFRQQRVQQTTVDAAALAGAQALPGSPSGAIAAANDYANRNGGVAGASITVVSKYAPNDAVVVSQTRTGTGFFSKLFNTPFVSIKTKATAIAEVPEQAQYVAPIVVNIKHPMLQGTPGCPCFNVPTTIPLGKNGAPGSFALVNLIYNSPNGTVGASTLADWIAKGYDQYLPLGVYFSDPGAKWNNNTIQNALIGRYNTDLLFPVYDTLTQQGSNAEYHIIAWAGFHLTSVSASGTEGSIDGYFTQVTWQGIVDQAGLPNPYIPDLGVHSVALVD